MELSAFWHSGTCVPAGSRLLFVENQRDFARRGDLASELCSKTFGSATCGSSHDHPLATAASGTRGKTHSDYGNCDGCPLPARLAIMFCPSGLSHVFSPVGQGRRVIEFRSFPD